MPGSSALVQVIKWPRCAPEPRTLPAGPASWESHQQENCCPRFAPWPAPVALHSQGMAARRVNGTHALRSRGCRSAATARLTEHEAGWNHCSLLHKLFGLQTLRPCMVQSAGDRQLSLDVACWVAPWMSMAQGDRSSRCAHQLRFCCYFLAQQISSAQVLPAIGLHNAGALRAFAAARCTKYKHNLCFRHFGSWPVAKLTSISQSAFVSLKCGQPCRARC